MFIYICLNCGYEEYVFGYGGVVVEVDKFGVFLLVEVFLYFNIWIVVDGGILIVV